MAVTWHLSYACIGFGVVSSPLFPFCSAILNPSKHMTRNAEPVCSLFCDGHHDGLGKSSGRTLLVVDIDFDLHSQVVVVSRPCPLVVVYILIFYASTNTSPFLMSPEYFLGITCPHGVPTRFSVASLTLWGLAQQYLILTSTCQ